MGRIALVTNIPAPYRVDLFYYMQTQIKKHEFHVIYTSENEDNRSWKIKKEKKEGREEGRKGGRKEK